MWEVVPFLRRPAVGEIRRPAVVEEIRRPGAVENPVILTAAAEILAVVAPGRAGNEHANARISHQSRARPNCRRNS